MMRYLHRDTGVRGLDRDAVAVAALAVVARLVFWIVTERVWEDALITLAHAENAVRGLGLTHHPGEGVVYGFSSALSVLIPLAGDVFVAGSGIFALRVTSLIAAVVAVLGASALLGELDVSKWPSRFALVFLALDPMQVFFGMAGMETQIAVAILVASALAVTRQSRSGVIGLSLALALLVRPDLLIWVVIVLVLGLIRSPRRAIVAGAVTLATIAPWLIFTVAYYGSPVPQTIIAKSLTFTPIIGSITDAVVFALEHVNTLGRTLAPFFENTMVVAAPVPAALPAAIAIIGWSFVVVGSIALARRAPEIVVFFWAFTVYRVLALPPSYFDWYSPPHLAIGVVLLAAGIDRGLPRKRTRTMVSIAMATAFAMPLIFTVGLEARVQRDVENAIRVPVGIYLRDHVAHGEAVALEPAGYIGYYSRAEIWDYPGLTSSIALATVEAIPRDQRSVNTMLVRLKAPWIVVRPWEWDTVRHLDPALAARYQLCTSFTGAIGSEVEWGGLRLTSIDGRFDVRHLDGCTK